MKWQDPIKIISDINWAHHHPEIQFCRLMFIPHICHPFYTTTFWGLKILHSKLRKFATKIEQRLISGMIRPSHFHVFTVSVSLDSYKDHRDGTWYINKWHQSVMSCVVSDNNDWSVWSVFCCSHKWHQRVTLESETKENTKYVGAHPRPLDIIICCF